MFENIIADLLSISGVKSVVIASTDGSLVESEAAEKLDDMTRELHAALVAEIFNNASNALARLSSDSAEFVVVDGKESRVVVSRAGDLLLGLVTGQNVNYGLLKIEVKKAVEKITAMI